MEMNRQLKNKTNIFFQLVCIIVENESDIAAFKDFVDDASAPAPVAPSAPSAPKPVATSPPVLPPPPAASNISAAPTKTGSRIFASPLAKRLASEKGLDLSVRTDKYI